MSLVILVTLSCLFDYLTNPILTLILPLTLILIPVNPYSQLLAQRDPENSNVASLKKLAQGYEKQVMPSSGLGKGKEVG